MTTALDHRAGHHMILKQVSSTDIYDEDETYAYEEKPDNSKNIKPIEFTHQLFTILSENGGETISIQQFIKGLTCTGIRTTDPRLQKCMAKIETFRDNAGYVQDDFMVDRETFHQLVKDDVDLVRKAYTTKYAVPEFNRFTEAIKRIFNSCKDNNAGKVSTSNPQFSKFSHDRWGLSICTVDGQRFGIGDCDMKFPIHSAIKPLLYAIAMHELKPEEVHKYVGQEPSGEIADMIKLDYNNKPHNPMINTGAITMCSLLRNDLRPADRFDYVTDMLRKFSGEEYIGFNNTIFLSEREVSDRNFALAYYLKENNCFPPKTNLRETMDFFNQMMAIESNCESMSVVAATLANGGICPLAPQNGTVVDGEAVQHTLSLMHSCGMYDYSGQFAFQVGLPAKSSRVGTILLVVPNVCGICMWSPAVDKSNNSVRGLQFCRELVNVFNFHHNDSLVHTCHKEDPRRRQQEKISHEITGLLFGASNGDLSAITRMSLSGTVDMSMCDYDGRSALHVAAAEGQTEIVEFLVENHHDMLIDALDRFDKTPLDDAEEFGQKEVAAYLKVMLKSRPNQTRAGRGMK